MSKQWDDRCAPLVSTLQSIGQGAVAVSGGVDSMTLAYVAHRVLGHQVTMYHATSAAVPPEATARVQRYAASEGWQLELVDAGEFDDPRYMENPINRCYYCKTHLYDAIQTAATGIVMSGTNTDDLGDFRPGLTAASERRVRQPLVESDISKADVRAIARALSLEDLSELPAAPCLSSRIETGIAIDPSTLRAVHRTERLIGERLSPRTVRCRVRSSGVVIELDPESLAALTAEAQKTLQEQIAAHFDPLTAVKFTTYAMGSAFVAPPGST